MNGRLHALLIGIDQYIPPKPGGGVSYPPLTGAVRDVRRVGEFLRSLSTPPVRILELTATSGGEPEPVEPRDQWPTYAAMVGKFRELTAGAEPGDQVYIHYSGHGGRTPTLFEAEKGPREFDESLVPCTISDPNERYLRDVEVAMLIEEMIDKGLFVTVVLDCCHSGGIRRGPQHPVPRGLPVPDGRLRRKESLVGTREQLALFLRPRTFSASGGKTFRHGHLEGWLAEPNGYVQLAACRPQETAFEYPLANGEAQGALTYRLLEALREGGMQATWQEIYDVVFSRVHDQFQKQAPILLGEKGRTFLGSEALAPPAPVGEVKVYGGEGDWIQLEAGRAQGVNEGMRFAIYPPAMHRGIAERRSAVAEVIKVGATECRAKIVQSMFRDSVKPGGLAIPLDGVAIQRPAVCGLAIERPDVLDRVSRALKHDRTGALKRAEPGEPADLQVSVNEKGEYEVRDREGQPLPNLGPPVRSDATWAEQDLLRRLIHLAKFFDLERTDNHDLGSPLRGKLRLSVARAAETPGPIELRCGESLQVEVENASSRALNVVVLDLQPDWGITQIFPSKRDGEYWTLDPKQTKTVQIKAYLPKDCEESKDVIKVFATVGIPSFLWRELPPLQGADTTRRVLRNGSNGSSDDPLAVGHLVFKESASQEWTTAQIEVLVRR
jgi:hypothetical protein